VADAGRRAAPRRAAARLSEVSHQRAAGDREGRGLRARRLARAGYASDTGEERLVDAVVAAT
jgi:hypothetical protein